MDTEVYNAVLAKLEQAGFTIDSSTELAYHIALHYPEHGRYLLDLTPEPEVSE